MSIWGSIFGSKETGDALVNGAVKGIDALFFTDEEKSQASKEGFQLYIEYQKATAPQNVARRYIALMVGALWSILILLSTGLAVFNHDSFSQVWDIAEKVSIVWGLIVTFYYVKRIGQK